MGHDWGRFTAYGSEEVEGRLRALLGQVAERSAAVLDPDEYRALVLIGGYGRGEGGVERVDGREMPHNNLDFLLIVNDQPPTEQLLAKAKLEKALAPLADSYGIAMDVATIAASKLEHSPALVMWYDMRFGHKTVLGDAGFVPSLRHFRLSRIPAWDIRNLLVNRGTLLVINDYLAERGAADAAARRLMVKHIMKAVIGYGDALLYFLGGYHWSYLEKQRRMRANTQAFPEFREAYDEALEFRFRPDYAAYEGRDLSAWMDDVRGRLAPQHLVCESKRLQAPGLTWDAYPEAALRHAVFEDALSPRAWAKKAALLTSGRKCPVGGFWAGLGYRMLGLRGLFPIVFPPVGYHLDLPVFCRLAAEALGARNCELGEMRRAYLHSWSRVGDINFLNLLRKWDLSLEPEPGGP